MTGFDFNKAADEILQERQRLITKQIPTDKKQVDTSWINHPAKGSIQKHVPLEVQLVHDMETYIRYTNETKSQLIRRLILTELEKTEPAWEDIYNKLGEPYKNVQTKVIVFSINENIDSYLKTHRSRTGETSARLVRRILRDHIKSWKQSGRNI